MKRPRNLTVAERQHIEEMGIAAENWLISKKKSDEWLLVHRLTNQTKVVPAP